MTTLRSWVGIGICVGAAIFLCLFLNESANTRCVAPAVSLQAVILAALYSGRISALVGSVAAGLIFNLFLFPPIGSLLIHDPTEIAMLVLFQVASIFVAFLSPRLRSHPPGRFPG